MKRVVLLLVGVVALMCGCKTTEVGPASGAAVLGQPVQSVVSAAKGHQIRFFDARDKELPALPEKQAGTVSIYNKDMTGQDNYVFDATGLITKHQRSYGEDYPNGVWKVVAER